MSDPRVTIIPDITARSRNAVQKQIRAVKWLLEANLTEESRDAIAHLIEGIEELVDLAPQIEDAANFAVSAGWIFGSKNGVSEQNKKSIQIRHEPSSNAKEKLLTLWRTGHWKTKVSCVHDNYEALMREVGLWQEGVKESKPSEQTLIRWLQKQ